MAASYVPSKEQDLSVWALNFSTLITANPSRYGLSPADATNIATVCNGYIAALTAAVDPATRTQPSVAAKDGAREAMLAVVRSYAQQIRLNNGVSNDDKSALGLNLPNNTRSPIPAPSTSPLMTLIGATPGNITARFADTNTPARRAFPPGVAGLQVYVTVAAAAVIDPATAVFRGIITKQPFALSFDAGDNAKTATVFARWINRKGQPGPWSNPVSMTIVA